jgi:ABC-2 type transport system ATP-binding protein
MDFAVSCKGLIKRYGAVTAVDGLDLAVRAGECFGLLGPNGAGKTTTVEILQGLLEPDQGEITILGLSWKHHEAELKQKIGAQLQETVLPEKLTVFEVITLFRSFYTKGPDVRDVLDQVGLKEKVSAWTKNLSGGQRQRLAVACALVSDPALLFLDEPTTGLDPQSRHQMWDIIAGFKARGKTVILTTHYMEEAERLCDRVAVVDHGKTIALGSPRELIAGLGADQVVEFGVSAGTVDDALLKTLPGVGRVAHEDGKIRLTVAKVHETVPALLKLLGERGATLSGLATHHATLEDVFILLTGRHLRDG